MERYEIREWIATEPLYWSYAAHDLEHELPVMVRVIRRTILPRKLDHQSFARRLEPLTALTLPGVAQLRRTDREDGNTLVVSELIDGLPLRSLIDLRRQDGRAFSALETLAVLTLMAEALEAAIPVIHHGDLRPSQVLIRDQGLDLEALGVAAALPWEETVRALKDSPQVCGYLAPEVLEGQHSDTRSDIYSLAIIACELLTGRIPPSEPSLLDDFLSHLPPMTDDVLRRSLSPDMSRRDSAPTELVGALAAVLGVEPLREPRAGASTPFSDKLHDPTVEITRDEDGTAPFEPSHLVRGAAAEQQVPRDPAVPAAPDREGTQQITEDMLEPVHDAEDDEDADVKDPAVAVEPAAEGTQQITQDMLEPLADSLDAPLETSFLDTPSSTAAEPEVESLRSLGLDPKLVRAARRLDRERVGQDDESPTIRRKAGPSARAATERAAAAEGVYFVPRPADLMKELAAEVEPPQLALEPPDEVSEEAPEELPLAQPSVPAEAGGLTERPVPLPVLDPDATIPRPLAAMSGQAPRGERRAIPLENPWSPDEKDSSGNLGEPSEIPAALLGGTLGPIQEKVVGGDAFSSPVLTDPREFVEPEVLPAVVIDDALTEAFGPSKLSSDEPTFRMERPRDLEDPTIKSPAARRGSSPWRWVVPVALLGGVLLAAVGVLFLWVFLGS